MAKFQRTLVTFRSQLLLPYITRFSWSPGFFFLRGGSAPRSNHFPLIHYFLQKRHPFRIPSKEDWYPLHIPSLQLCISFNCCNCTAFKIWTNPKTRTERLLDLFTTIEYICQLYWVFSQTTMTDFPILSYTSADEISALSNTWSLKMVIYLCIYKQL